MVAGRNSGADLIIWLAGGVNAMDSIEGYKAVSDEAVIAAAPDVILMMDRGAQTSDAQSLFKQPSFAATPAARNARLIVMDGQYLLGFGPRTPEAASELMAAIYPEASRPKAGPARP